MFLVLFKPSRLLRSLGLYSVSAGQDLNILFFIFMFLYFGSDSPKKLKSQMRLC